LEDMGVRREIFIMKFNNKKKTLAAQPYWYYRFLSFAVLDKITQDKIIHDQFLKHWTIFICTTFYAQKVMCFIQLVFEIKTTTFLVYSKILNELCHVTLFFWSYFSV
jgi:hypothetical protein